MKLRNKSEFHEEIFSLSYTDLFFPLYGLISLHRKNLIDIQKNLPNSISNIKRTEFVRYTKWIIANNKKGLANSHNIYTFSHISIILNPAGKYMVKINDTNIRSRRPTLTWWLGLSNQEVLPGRQQGDVVGATQLRSIRTNRSLC